MCAKHTMRAKHKRWHAEAVGVTLGLPMVPIFDCTHHVVAALAWGRGARTHMAHLARTFWLWLDCQATCIHLYWVGTGPDMCTSVCAVKMAVPYHSIDPLIPPCLVHLNHFLVHCIRSWLHELPSACQALGAFLLDV